MEEWRDVPGYEGLYQISISTKEGKCRSLNYRRSGKTKELSNTIAKDNRVYWGLTREKVRDFQQAAVWIALTYPELVQNEWFEGAEIDHIDTDRLNNQPINLRWVDSKTNSNNPLTLKHKSESHKSIFLNRKDQSKWVIKLSLDNEILHFYPSLMQASRETGIKYQNISKCCLGGSKTAGGFVWRYA